MKEETTEKQKVLNHAFYATLVMLGFSLLLFISDKVVVGWFGLAESILLPTLGYLTKKGNKSAVIALLTLFIIDRIMLFINWREYLATPLSIVSVVLISFVLWGYYYRAYLIMKNNNLFKRTP